MEILIDIPEKVYTYIQREWEEYDFDSVLNHVMNGIKRGTPLPEHHGRLIDISEYEKYFNTAITYDDGDHNHVVYTNMIPTIIEGE